MNGMYQILRSQLKLWFGRGVHRSYSQSGEDLLVAGLLSGVEKGVYVDVGAYHPIQYSNTYSLYKKGWSGFVIEPNEQFRSLYRFFRTRDHFLNVGVGEKSGVADYYMFSDGAYNTFDAKEADLRKKQNYPKFLGTKNLPVLPLSNVFKENAIDHVDFLSIDVEGLDVMVLESHDWSFFPKVIVIEDNTLKTEEFQKSPAYIFLRSKGYSLVVVASRTLIFSHST